jgi:type IV fimbrial biogenesis protein FimT
MIRPPAVPLPPRIKGFTLTELMVTVAVASILAVIAGPSFTGLIASQRIRTASFDLMAHLTLARSEAIKQNADVTVASASGTNSWAGGWAISGAGGTIKVQPVYSGLTITAGTGTVSSIVYNRSGRVVSNASVTFQISDDRPGSSVQPSCVTVGITGQPTSKKGAC